MFFIKLSLFSIAHLCVSCYYQLFSDGVAFVETDLPFAFTFYEMTFNRVNISTFDAFLTFVNEDKVLTQIDVSRRPGLEPIPTSKDHFLFGSPSEETFVVRWNKSYELILYSTGTIIFKYGDIEADDLDLDSKVVGIGFSIEKRSDLNFFRIDKAPEHHIRRGLVVRYDPLETCSSLYKTCSDCVNSKLKCQWCGHRCQESFLTCPSSVYNTCLDFPVAIKSDQDTQVGFQPQHVAAIVGLFLVVFGLVTGITLLYGYLKPESWPGRALNRLRIAPYSRFWERQSISEPNDGSNLRRDSQATMISTITSL